MTVATGALYSGTSLANVRYKWVAGGVPSGEQNSGITQPDLRFSFFRIAADFPTNAEEVIIYDTSNSSNWNTITVI